MKSTLSIDKIITDEHSFDHYTSYLDYFGKFSNFHDYRNLGLINTLIIDTSKVTNIVPTNK